MIFAFVYSYEGLGLKEIRNFLDKSHPEVYEYLPEPNIELPKTPKAWIGNVCATLLQDKFAKWIKRQVDARHKKVTVKKDILIRMDPELAEIFRKSTAVSSMSFQLSEFHNHILLYNKQRSISKPSTGW